MQPELQSIPFLTGNGIIILLNYGWRPIMKGCGGRDLSGQQNLNFPGQPNSLRICHRLSRLIVSTNTIHHIETLTAGKWQRSCHRYRGSSAFTETTLGSKDNILSNMADEPVEDDSRYDLPCDVQEGYTAMIIAG